MSRVVEFLARRRIPLTWVGALVYLAAAKPDVRGLVVGGLLMLAGEGVRLWASGHIEKNVRLARTGPYAHVRHPLYFGSALIGLGLAVASGQLLVALVVVGILGSLLGAAICREERRLSEHFGEEYETYRREVPAMIPRLRPYARGGSYDWAAVRRHREGRAVLGIVAGLVVLAIKSAVM